MGKEMFSDARFWVDVIVAAIGLVARLWPRPKQKIEIEVVLPKGDGHEERQAKKAPETGA